MSSVNNAVISSMRKDGKAIQVDGDWYSSFNPIAGVAVGDTVTFDYKINGSYKNIVGKVKKDGSATTASPTTATTSGGRTNKFANQFPIDVYDGQRSIIRQNALTNARELVVGTHKGTVDLDKFADEIIRVARKFEAYATGDLDIAIANDILANRTTAATPVVKKATVQELLDAQ